MKSLAILLWAFAGSLFVFVLPASPQSVQSVATAAGRSVCIVLADRENGTTSGTGFVVADGFVLTAHHVVQGASHLRVLCPDHPEIGVTLANADAVKDVALLHNSLVSIRPLPLGDSAKVQVGQEIVVIGFPRVDLVGAETATVTQGIISSVRAGVVQIQAPVGPGNSGSPILTLQGQVIGVVRAVLGSQLGTNFATSFATAINAAKPFLFSAGGMYGGVSVGNPPPVRQAQRPAWRPTWAVGDTWAYKTPWGQATYVVTSVAGLSVTMMETLLNTPPATIGVDATHLGRATPSWLPEVVWIDFPLAPGKSYSRVYNAQEHFSYHVGNMEQITVLAGSFSAIRVDSRVCNPRTSRCGGISFWYAPAAKWFVRIAWDNSLYFNKDRRGSSMELLSVVLSQ